MKLTVIILVAAVMMMSSSSRRFQAENIEFVCLKKHVTSKTCHYNFTIDGGKFRYVDIGCKYKKDEVIDRVKEGAFAVAKDWKIDCPSSKDKKNK
jgi:hypothetical protein